MRSSYKQIPKELRKHYNNAIWSSLKRAIWANFNFSKIYNNRHWLFSLGEVQDNLNLPEDHLYWYADSTEREGGIDANPLSYVRCWYGDEGYQATQGFNYLNATASEKKKQSRKWLRRNNDWNNKAKIGLKFKAGFTIEERLINTGLNPNQTNYWNILTWRNETKKGEQSVILKLNGTNDLYYRYSYTLPLGKFNPLRLLGYKFINQMRGVESRYLFKIRLFK